MSNDVTDAIVVEAAGRPLLLVHGGPGLSDYMAVLDDETVGWRRIRYQQRGIAPAPTSGPFTVEQHLQDLAAVLDAAGVEQAVVLGHSWGGHLALHAAVALCDRVLGVVAVEPLGVLGDGGASALATTLAARLLPGALEKAAEIGQRSAAAGLVGDAADEAATELLSLSWPGYFAKPETAPPPPPGLRVSVVGNTETMTSALSEMEGGFGDRLRHIRVPVEIVVGACSPLPNDAGMSTADLIPGSHTTVVPDAGHLPWHEQPGCVRDALSRVAAELS